MPASELTGGIPSEFGLLTKLTELNVKFNRLKGRIPTEFGLLTNLQILELEGNRDLTGIIPSELDSNINLLLLLLPTATIGFSVVVVPNHSRPSTSTTQLFGLPVGVFFGTSTGSTESAAELIAAEFGAPEPIDIDLVGAGNLAAEFQKYDALIVGTPTWNTGADTGVSMNDSATVPCAWPSWLRRSRCTKSVTIWQGFRWIPRVDAFTCSWLRSLY